MALCYDLENLRTGKRSNSGGCTSTPQHPSPFYEPGKKSNRGGCTVSTPHNTLRPSTRSTMTENRQSLYDLENLRTSNRSNSGGCTISVDSTTPFALLLGAQGLQPKTMTIIHITSTKQKHRPPARTHRQNGAIGAALVDSRTLSQHQDSHVKTEFSKVNDS